MWTVRNVLERFALVSLVVLLGACGIPLATLHGPTPVPVNTSAATVGIGPVFFDEEVGEDLLLFAVFGAYVGVRRAVSERLELGASAGLFNGVTAEAKYNLIPGPVYVSANLAASMGFLFDIDLWGGSGSEAGAMTNVGLHPALLVGTERVYGGAKLVTFPFNPNVSRPWTVVFAGGSFGGATRIVPEIAWMRDPADGQTDWFGGIALRRTLRAPVLR